MTDASVPPLSPFADLLGMTLREADAEHTVLVMEAGSEHGNRTGFVHGGAMVSLADTAATVRANIPPAGASTNPEAEPAPFVVSVDLHAVMMGNQQGGVVRAEARFLRRGRRVTVIRTRVRGEGDRLLVEVTTTHLPS